MEKHSELDNIKHNKLHAPIILAIFLAILLIFTISAAIIMRAKTVKNTSSEYPKILVYENVYQPNYSTSISVGLEGSKLQEVKRIVNDDNSVSITLIFREEE